MNILITEKQLIKLTEMNLIKQPNGISCGPTCIKMVGEFIGGLVDSIDEICLKCGTDSIVGTPPERMIKGLDSYNFNYEIHSKNTEPFVVLKHIIDSGNVAILRTITHGNPHWIVIHSYEEDIFNVNDPWLGTLTYSETELKKIWEPRDYYFFEIKTNKHNDQKLNDVTIRPLEKSDLKYIIPNLEEILSRTGLSKETIMNIVGKYDNISIVAEVNGNVAGFYFLRYANIPNDKINPIFKDLKGVEGILLGVIKKYQKLRIGEKLIEFPKTIPDVDYIWGYQLKSLKNIDFWLKRRKIHYENSGLYITYEIF